MATKKTERTITDFLDNEYKNYSFYVISNRACPSLVDGFKTGARKIMHASFKGALKNGDTKKVTNLAGETMNYSLYQHGDASLNSTIVTLSQDFSFNLPPLYIDGQGGSLRSQDSASPRYLYVRHSKYSDIWKTDYDLLEFEEDEGQSVEPKYYLPIIPVLLCQRQEGMAPGYRFSNMSYNPLDVIKACIEFINKKYKEGSLENFTIKPYIRTIDKKQWKYEDGHWVNRGEFTWDDKKREIKVTNLPYDMTFDSFEKLLNKLAENEDIREWKDMSYNGTIDYRIDCKKGKWAGTLKVKGVNEKIETKLKLKKIVPDDLLWVVDENKKIQHFNTPQELIEYFVKFRITKYKERKKRLVKIIQERVDRNDELVKFINLVCNGKLKIRNRSKKEIKVDMDAVKLPMELISTPMSKVTIEERDELLKQNEELKKELEYIKNTTENQMYLNDLTKLYKELEKDFK